MHVFQPNLPAKKDSTKVNEPFSLSKHYFGRKNMPLYILFFFLSVSFIRAQPQKLPVKKIFLFPGNIALVYREGKVQINNGKVSLENLENALYNKYWIAPGGPFNVTRVITGEDTVYHKVRALNFFDMLRANVGAQAEVTYKIGDELEGAIGEILPIPQGSELAMILQADGHTVMIKKSQIEQVAIKGMANSFFMEPRLEKATFVETDYSLENAIIQQFYFTNQLKWFPAYSLKLLTDSTANLSLKASIDNNAENYEQVEVHFCIGAPSFAGGNQIEDCALELIPKLPLGDASPSVSSIVHGLLSQQTQNTQEQLNREHFMPGPFAAIPISGGIEVWDKQTLTIKKNSKSYITHFSKDVAYNLLYNVSIPNNWDTTRLVMDKAEILTFPFQKKMTFSNTAEKILPPAPLVMLDATEAPITKIDLKFYKKEAEASLDLGQSKDVEIKIGETVTKVQPKFKKNEKDKIAYDKYFLSANVQIKNWSTAKAQTSFDKLFVGEFKVPGFRVETLQKGLNSVYKVSWSGVVEPGGSKSFRMDYFYYKPLP
jgi:hypothetical protein